MRPETKAPKPLRLGWLSTGRGPGSRSLLSAAHNAISEGSLDASIEFVLSTRELGEAEGSDQFLAQAESYGMETIPLSFRGYRERNSTVPDWRERYNERLHREIRRHNVDALVFAGLLLVVSENVVNEYPAINLHPAAPKGPVGAWQEVISELMLERSPESGVSVQVATPELDLGPVVAFCTFPIGGPKYDSLWKETLNRLANKIDTYSWDTNWLSTRPEVATPWGEFRNELISGRNSNAWGPDGRSSRDAWDTTWLAYRNSVVHRFDSFDWNTPWPSLRRDWETLLHESVRRLWAGMDSIPFDTIWPSLRSVWEPLWRDFRNSLAHDMEVESQPLFAKIRQEGLRREALTLVAALRQIANGIVTIEDGLVKDASGEPLSGGLDITDDIERLLAGQPDS